MALLRQQRASVVNDADARLRQLERDLHDGTQAQLTAIGMQIGEARDLLMNDGDRGLALDLLGKAQQTTQDAARDLREIAQGIHPAALDTGLDVALQSLASRASVPTELRVGETVKEPELDPAVRSIAYYTIAELLNNATKHAEASKIWVRVNRLTSQGLHIDVTDNGKGGAHIVPPVDRVIEGNQTGLFGLEERLAAVDGGLSISSPEGGPTSIDVWLPTTI